MKSGINELCEMANMPGVEDGETKKKGPILEREAPLP
ncbi:hypothetical protein T05_15637 [Trichinella murrelli]|uniref:Uncharacterized protein n=1 Tax=Trichinella murrelli TaxID=144512 RepID=A0A0V0SV84_9BILA|nr:hypothetical protein T05_15637 [Trichinella murrelli]